MTLTSLKTFVKNPERKLQESVNSGDFGNNLSRFLQETVESGDSDDSDDIWQESSKNLARIFRL